MMVKAGSLDVALSVDMVPVTATEFIRGEEETHFEGRAVYRRGCRNH